MKHNTRRAAVAMIICLVVGVSVPALSAGATGVGPALVGTDWGANAVSLRGHNGSRFLFVCPAGGPIGRLWGTDTYTDDSSVCTAAVHKGLLGFIAGGYLTIQIAPGLASYVGSSRNGVTTRSYGHWVGSFTFAGTRVGTFR